MMKLQEELISKNNSRCHSNSDFSLNLLQLEPAVLESEQALPYNSGISFKFKVWTIC